MPILNLPLKMLKNVAIFLPNSDMPSFAQVHSKFFNAAWLSDQPICIRADVDGLFKLKGRVATMKTFNVSWEGGR